MFKESRPIADKFLVKLVDRLCEFQFQIDLDLCCEQNYCSKVLLNIGNYVTDNNSRHFLFINIGAHSCICRSEVANYLCEYLSKTLVHFLGKWTFI